MPHFLLFAAIILCITVSESRIELSNSLKDSMKAAKEYYVSDYAADFNQIPQVSSTRKLRRRNLCDKDRYHYDVYEEHRVHLMDPIFIKNNKGKCHPELEDNKELKRKYYIHEHLGDYINASPVDITIAAGKPTNLRFIASMAPTQESIPDFWQMIWDESVSVIVMLTNLKDNGYYIEDGMPTAGLVEKCAQYWPEKPNTPMLIDFPSQIQVTMSKPTTKNYGYVRTFTVTHTVQKDKTHKLIQYHFTQWPDLGVPGDYNMFLEFMRDVQKASKNSSSRILVHCSQGTGRTGTFLMAYTMLHRIEANLSIYPKEIRQIVEHLRECRQGCVEKLEQYYIGKVMIDLLENGKISPLVKA